MCVPIGHHTTSQTMESDWTPLPLLSVPHWFFFSHIGFGPVLAFGHSSRRNAVLQRYDIAARTVNAFRCWRCELLTPVLCQSSRFSTAAFSKNNKKNNNNSDAPKSLPSTLGCHSTQFGNDRCTLFISAERCPKALWLLHVNSRNVAFYILACWLAGYVPWLNLRPKCRDSVCKTGGNSTQLGGHEDWMS